VSGFFNDPTFVHRLAEKVTDAQLEQMPELRARYGATGRQHCIEDTTYHLRYLGEAVEFGDGELFADYIAWAKVMLAARGIGLHDLTANLQHIAEGLREEEASEMTASAIAIIDLVLARLESMPESIPSFVDADGALEDIARRYLDLIRAGKRLDADALVQQAVDAGTSLTDLYLRVFEPVQHEIGRLWQMNQITVAQEHFCTAAVQRSMSHLYSALFSGMPGRRRVVAACAGGELHEIGLRMVADLLESSGWDTVYLGANVPTESIIRTVAEAPTSLIAISTTITPNLRTLSKIIEALRADPVTAHVPIIVGGYPFRLSNALVARIGADGWAMNAAEAVRRANELVPA
jgi:methanogenic corrinoid protein MtbC1